MNRQEANTLLDEHKHGIRIHPVVEVTKALWLTGDLRVIQKLPEPSNPDGLDKGLEGPCMA
jgi:hypothetical protein